MLTIRLQRVGKPKHPTYRLIINEKARDTNHGSLELLGSYNPQAAQNGISLKKDRILYWIGKGAQTSATVKNLLIAQGVLTGKKEKSVYLTTKRKAKIAEKKAAGAPAPEAPTAEAPAATA